jgi:U3 small nucleolar RNA-associated protein 14
MKAFRILTLLTFTLLSPLLVCAQDSSNRSALKGMVGLGTWYSADPDKLKDVGLTLSQINDDVTLRLRKEGIVVLEGEHAKAEDGVPHLVTTVSLMADDNQIIFVVQAEVQQWVSLDRDKKQSLYLPTWTTKGVIGKSGRTTARDTLRKVLGEVIDKFINDYLAVNPKR